MNSHLNLQLLILVITVIFGVLDLHTQRVPNVMNLILFILMFGVGYQLKIIAPYECMINMFLITLMSFALFYSGVLGGGDCKYMIALSPIIKIEILLEVLFVAMIFFLLAYTIKCMTYYLKYKKIDRRLILASGKMPFMWTFIPSLILIKPFV